MGFSRRIAPPAPPAPDALAAAMAGLGMAVAVAPLPQANIEDTVLAASRAGMEDDDYRVLGLLAAWLDVHRPCLNADRLVRLIGALPAGRTTAFWHAQAVRWRADARWRRLLPAQPDPALPLLRVGNAFQVERQGEDARFAGSGLVVPAGVLRVREGDVLDPAALARRHRAYHYRVLIGPSYRADCWAALSLDPSLGASAVARAAYASFATAWQVKRDFALLAA